MLDELTIRDFAIIDRLSVRFEPGLNLLTGETGAGKSILIGALGFALGARVDTGIIRSGAEEASVSAVYSVGHMPAVEAWLDAHDMMTDDGTVIIRRSLKKNGRGSIYIQSVPAVRQDLQDLGALLVEVHGQRDGHTLLRKERHRELLDAFAGLDPEVEAYRSKYNDLNMKRRELEHLAASEMERARELDLLRFAVDEIDAASPRENEDDELAEEERRLSQHEKLYSAVMAAHDLLADAEGAVVRLRKARSQLEVAAGIDQRLSDAARRLDDAFYEVEDIEGALASHADHLAFEPGRLEEIESRLAVLQKLKRKYGPDLSAVIRYRNESVEQLERLANQAQDRGVLELEINRLETVVRADAEVLMETRKAAASRLQVAVGDIMVNLGMPHARFAVRVERLPAVNGKVVVGPFGLDELEFMFSANKGEPLRNLADVASGGELSRLMLSLKTVLAEDSGAQTLIFDEIDTGIGGEVAVAVGGHLAELSVKKQILCITHLASIAARADNHLVVSKNAGTERTTTIVGRIEGQERVQEIARMLSGDQESRASLEHASELVQKLGRTRGR